jgi:hypothetical protein
MNKDEEGSGDKMIQEATEEIQKVVAARAAEKEAKAKTKLKEEDKPKAENGKGHGKKVV